MLETRPLVAQQLTKLSCELLSYLPYARAKSTISIWDRDHHSAYHSYPTQENRERLVGLAVAERESVLSITSKARESCHW